MHALGIIDVTEHVEFSKYNQHPILISIYALLKQFILGTMNYQMMAHIHI
uniref:Uncharacterized protein n=1 Tax=Arundo donax TaxID=35708 RepID=A0A0A9CPJ5_ARUDO